ncbi:aquaporin Z [Bryocella elongata]|uniref:Aquaporin Z n=1 Tax=Bryocella elongata TaxID=863522 RepID=A0A1H5YEG3_9BACT|nr:aquaporin [Bryocella elongata]SEG22017.1 aquaporin Z [Bryocella elongata]
MATWLKPRPSHYPSLAAALRAHWPLYLYEAAELAAFMLSACLCTALLFDPHSPLAGLPSTLRRFLMGLSMGLTAVVIIKSPWGRRSGAHFNPAISLTFYRLGKIGPRDTVLYVLAHFAGAPLGVLLAALLLGPIIRLPQVNYAVTVPGIGGPSAAFAAETFMAALLMATVLVTSNNRRLAAYTTWLMGLLITSYVFVFAPVSGFSINPARTFGSALEAHLWTAVWIYFTAPLLGMFAAAEAYVQLAQPDPTRHLYFSHRRLTHEPAELTAVEPTS